MRKTNFASLIPFFRIAARKDGFRESFHFLRHNKNYTFCSRALLNKVYFFFFAARLVYMDLFVALAVLFINSLFYGYILNVTLFLLYFLFLFYFFLLHVVWYRYILFAQTHRLEKRHSKLLIIIILSYS